MSYLIDVVFIVREIRLLTFVVITSPMGILGSLLLLEGSSL